MSGEVRGPRPTVHVWGFFDDQGRRREQLAGIAVSDEHPFLVHQTVERNIRHFGGEITGLATTRTLGGWLVGTEFETPARKNAARMWHVITQADEPWPDPTTRPEHPSTEVTP